MLGAGTGAAMGFAGTKLFSNKGQKAVQRLAQKKFAPSEDVISFGALGAMGMLGGGGGYALGGLLGDTKVSANQPINKVSSSMFSSGR